MASDSVRKGENGGEGMTEFRKFVELDSIVYKQSGYTLNHETGYLQALYVPIAELRVGCEDATNE